MPIPKANKKPAQPTIAEAAFGAAKNTVFPGRPYEAESNPEPAEPMKMLGLRIPASDHYALKLMAVQQGVTMTELLQSAVRDLISRQQTS